MKNLSSVTFLQYTGPKKVKPPRLSNKFGQPFEDVCKHEDSLARAQLHDMNWLLSLFSLTELYVADPFSDGTIDGGTNIIDHTKGTRNGKGITHNGKTRVQTLPKINGEE